MSTHRHIDRICCIVLAVTIIITVLFMCGENFGLTSTARAMGYETKLFDTSKVHTVNIIIDDWDGFLETCTNEEYTVCAVEIDNEAFKNVAIRAKGNTSLSQVASYGNNRYSFKIEFDHYDSTKSYHGLDKLCLNNIIQDNTYMKDYICYMMMNEFGADSPLCSFVYITVNGEDWGLYLAVEGIEDSFLQRNYGNDYGELYKPDSQSMGGGRGNGGNFNMNDFTAKANDGENQTGQTDGAQTDNSQMPQGNPPDRASQNGDGTQDSSASEEMPQDGSRQKPNGMRGNMKPPSDSGEETSGEAQTDNFSKNDFASKFGGSDDVSLIYSDDEYSSYENIFGNAKTEVSDSDKDRLISSLQKLNSNEDISSVVDIDEVMKYFVVHNFVCNFDSYTGSMIHNYYLYEKDGQMSMIPWDYNLAFGTFTGSQNAETIINYPIDSPVSGGTVESRPMLAWIFANDEYTEMYHTAFSEFIEKFFDSGYIPDLIEKTAEMISPYVEKDPTKFCTYEEFEKGVAALKEFFVLRAESVSGQLGGSIPSTSDGQSADSSTLVSADGLELSAMGGMGNGMKNQMFNKPDETADGASSESDDFSIPTPPDNFELPSDIPDMPDGFDPAESFGGNPPDMPGFNGDQESASEKTSSQVEIMDTAFSSEASSEKYSGMPAESSEEQGSVSFDFQSLILLILSAGVLAVGVAVAFIYKKKS